MAFTNQGKRLYPATLLREKGRSFWAQSTLERAIDSPYQTLRLGNPRLNFPSFPEKASYQPARFFSRGPLDLDPKANRPPIPYLMIETNESPHPRPVPGTPLLLRSLCKGTGRLKATPQGMLYLDIDDKFILAMVPFLKAYGLTEPPYFHLLGTTEQPLGAHIPVVSTREAAFHFIDAKQEIGKEFSFEIEGLYSIQPTLWPEMEEVWFFQIRSPILEELRRRLFLTSLPSGLCFQAAFAIRPRLGLKKNPQDVATMRINRGFFAA